MHVVIWTALLSVPLIVFHKIETGLPNGFFLLGNLYHIGLFYFNAFYLYPRFMTRKRWPLYIVFLGIILGGSYYIKVGLMGLIGYEQPGGLYAGYFFFPPIPFLIASIIYRLITDRIQAERAEKEAQAERLASELKFLRSQVSPHFLFNVLTNMVSLARKKSDQLEPALIQLSDMLRYMLYETNGERFPVTKEVEYLRNYIELQQLRFGEDVRVQVDIEHSEPSCAIEPMLLIPFVENAFKHGIGLVKDPYIKIALQVKEQYLHFRVVNNYNRDNVSKDAGSGIGLANVRNRLRLLYGDKHTLTIQDNGEVYDADLKLALSC
ncbi:histidine kinase [Pseudoflavitalea sp. X16]|uniref:sensor histidine kinase n=1 Tax=Paraflavitalea devenefica TaxID=2716334 RepID=UPI00141E0384|nr:histidine kinase [Paraflavitalea devenefica]NII28563.1 histidine kinase [Paraflavitalea devenefica]